MPTRGEKKEKDIPSFAYEHINMQNQKTYLKNRYERGEGAVKMK